MSNLILNNCPLCNSADLEKKLTCAHQSASGEAFDLYQCNHCGLLFTPNIPQRENKQTNPSHCVCRRMSKKKVRLVLTTSLLQTGSLLDLGSGTNPFATAMQREGWKVKTIETHNCTESLKQLPPESYDVITVWHGMECIEDLVATWTLLRGLLSETGILIIALPNPASCDATHYAAHWAAYDAPRLWHFTPDTIQKWGAKHELVLAARHPILTDAFRTSVLSEKRKGSKAAFFRGLAMGGWLSLKAMNHRDKSSSMIYIFRNKRHGK